MAFEKISTHGDKGEIYPTDCSPHSPLVIMKCFVLLSLCALSLAKPQGKLVTETEGRIIGGEEAPKRELRIYDNICIYVGVVYRP